ncbi:MAG TPA: hypothetical protein VFE58_16910 [Tepidisphaeraceae bacterium]|nr:hypothetical protein [Tepidisphaeraceae bacterium]
MRAEGVGGQAGPGQDRPEGAADGWGMERQVGRAVVRVVVRSQMAAQVVLGSKAAATGVLAVVAAAVVAMR